MTDATVHTPYVKNLHIEYIDGSVSGLTADVSWNITVDIDDLTTQVQMQNVDVWGLLTANQKSALQTLANKIIVYVEG